MASFTLTEYRTWWKLNEVMPCPTVSEKCKCGHRIRRMINTTITCGKCRHTVLSYNQLRGH
jgi:hypothetical protein